MSTEISVTLEHEGIERILFLIHRDLARVRGNIIMAEEKLESFKDPNVKVPGRIRDKAQRTLQTAPKQQAVLEAAQGALQDALREARAEGLVG